MPNLQTQGNNAGSGNPIHYNLQVEINVNCHLFTGVLSANKLESQGGLTNHLS